MDEVTQAGSWLTVAEAAEKLDVPERSIRRWVAAGFIRRSRRPRRRATYILEADLRAMLAVGPGLISRQEAAEQGGVSERTMNRWRRAGWLRAIEGLTGRVYVSLEDVLWESRAHRARRAEEERLEAERERRRAERQRQARHRAEAEATKRDERWAQELEARLHETAADALRPLLELLGLPHE